MTAWLSLFRECRPCTELVYGPTSINKYIKALIPACKELGFDYKNIDIPQCLQVATALHERKQTWTETPQGHAMYKMTIGLARTTPKTFGPFWGNTGGTLTHSYQSRWWLAMNKFYGSLWKPTDCPIVNSRKLQLEIEKEAAQKRGKTVSFGDRGIKSASTPAGLFLHRKGVATKQVKLEATFEKKIQ